MKCLLSQTGSDVWFDFSIYLFIRWFVCFYRNGSAQLNVVLISVNTLVCCTNRNWIHIFYIVYRARKMWNIKLNAHKYACHKCLSRHTCEKETKRFWRFMLCSRVFFHSFSVSYARMDRNIYIIFGIKCGNLIRFISVFFDVALVNVELRFI